MADDQERLQSTDDLEFPPGDRTFLAFAHLALVPLIVSPISCCAPFAPVLGVLAVLFAMPRSSFARFYTVQLLAVELLLLVLALAPAYLLLALNLPTQWSLWIVAVIAVIVMLLGVTKAIRGRQWFIKPIALLIFTNFFLGETLDSSHVPGQVVYHANEKAEEEIKNN